MLGHASSCEGYIPSGHGVTRGVVMPLSAADVHSSFRDATSGSDGSILGDGGTSVKSFASDVLWKTSNRTSG
ncbi:MAG: hypothetical protein Kow0074_15980 [Candidatus Zixiibacteriota bacterium]